MYQGTSTRKLVVAKVDSYQDNIQQITVSDVEGDFKNNERIYDSYGNNGIVQLEGEAECRIVIGGTSEPVGTFINDMSMLGREYAVIQDSFRYQWFS